MEQTVPPSKKLEPEQFGNILLRLILLSQLFKAIEKEKRQSGPEKGFVEFYIA